MTAEHAPGVVAVIANSARFTPGFYDAAEDLRIIARWAVGFDQVNVEVATEHGVLVTVTPVHMTTVAEYAITQWLATMKRTYMLNNMSHGGDFSIIRTYEIEGSTLGLYGFGRIGRKLGQLMRPLVKNVVYYDEIGADVDWATPMELYDVLQTADLLSMHLPATAQTQHIINRETLAVMKDTAILINAARGALVDGWALAAALNEGRLGGAGLDVFTPEIPPMDSPLRTAKNILLTSHAAWYSEDAIRDAREEAVESVIEFIGGD